MKRFGKRLVVALSLAICAAPSPTLGQEIVNEDLFEKSLEAATQATEYYGVYENRKELRRMADIGYRVAQESGFTDFPISFYLVDMPVPNAFALPGGHVFLTRGMLDLGLDDDMLANLLGHEIGHVVHQHGMKIQRRATLLNVVSQALLIGVVIAADSGSRDRDTGPRAPPVGYPGSMNDSPRGDRILGTAAAGVVVSELLLRSYSREFEDQADEEGQRMAAAAGFDPDGARGLMDLMRERLPETKEYGYWRTHPFFDQRVQAAAARAELLKIQPAEPVEDYRRTTQRTLLAWRGENPVETKKDKPERGKTAERRGREFEEETPKEPLDLAKMAALTAWPKGPAAEELRLEKLHRRRELELAKRDLYRDYGAMITDYREVVEEVREVDEDSTLPATLETEITGFESERKELYPRAAQIFRGEVYETEFLEIFASNYPDSPEHAEIALALGEAYSRLGRPADAVGRFLAAWRADPTSAAGLRSRTGLRSLAPVLERLGALEELVAQSEDEEIRTLAERRLETMVSSFKELSNGSDYLKKFPDSPHAETVTKRLDLLADNLYGEVVLYQTVGDHAQALERITKILTLAPHSPAAARLRQGAVLEG